MKNIKLYIFIIYFEATKWTPIQKDIYLMNVVDKFSLLYEISNLIFKWVNWADVQYEIIDLLTWKAEQYFMINVTILKISCHSDLF